ncbi:hypothetical protein B4U80_14236 [Leptotrombidium deliense]|uniref:Uncharacterized protein n=1 Tax=Leptotrombidium deliense TaxID=299467 RepID=A0A443RZL0_9ACAR|nr:hypothetical protein B4U80_14236 [Leptotrombidium deliense]
MDCKECTYPNKQPTCDNYKELSDSHMSEKCGPGCVCIQGYVKVNDSSDECVKKSDCITCIKKMWLSQRAIQ